MKKDLKNSFFVNLIVIAFGFVLFKLVIEPQMSDFFKDNKVNPILFSLLSLLISFVIYSFKLHITHVIGLLLGHYKIISFNVLGLNLYKNVSEINSNDKWKFRLNFNYDGLCGGVNFYAKEEKTNPYLSPLTPIIFYIPSVLIFILLFINIDNIGILGILKNFYLYYIVVSGVLFIYNYYPAKIDTLNDGYVLVLLSNKINKKAYNTLLKIKSNEYFNIQVDSYKYFEELSDFSVEVNLKIARNYIYNKELKNAKTILDNILNSNVKLSKEVIYKTKSTYLLMFLYLLKIEDAYNFYSLLSEEEKKYIKTNYSLLTIKTSILYFGLIESSKNEITYQLEKLNKVLLKYSPEKKNYELFRVKELIDFVNLNNKNIKIEF